MVRVGLGRRTLINRMTVPQPSFLLQFADLGSGQVSTLEAASASSATFTRATTATTVDRTGKVVSVASGTPRSYYDPTSLAYLGYLAEGARTNLALQSEDFSSASWAKTDTVVTANAIAAPDGNATADLLTEGTAGTSFVVMSSSATVADSATVTASLWFKRSAVVQWVRVRVANNGATNGGNFYFDIQNGVKGSAFVLGSGTNPSSTITAYPNGWYRITATVTLAGGDVTATLGFASGTADGNATRVNNAAYYGWGAQLEAASFASSYIPTTTAAVTRNKSQLTYTVTSLLGSANTMFVSGRTPPAASGTQVYASVDDGSASNYFSVYYNSSGHIIAEAASGGGTVASLDLGAVAVNTNFKVAFAVSANDFSASLSGGAVVTDSSGAAPVSPTTLNVMQDNAAANQSFGTTDRQALFPRRLPNGVLQQLTSQ